MVIYGYIWLYMVIYGYICLHMVTYGYTYGYIWIVHIYKPRIRFVVPHIQVPPSTSNSESFS